LTRGCTNARRPASEDFSDFTNSAKVTWKNALQTVVESVPRLADGGEIGVRSRKSASLKQFFLITAMVARGIHAKDSENGRRFVTVLRLGFPVIFVPFCKLSLTGGLTFSFRNLWLDTKFLRTAL
jgi:hypothetical protein